MGKTDVFLFLLLFCFTGCNYLPGTLSGQENMPSSLPAESSAPVFDFATRTVRLNSGYEMPIMGLGTYSLSDEECYNSVTALLDAGGRLIDTAHIYGNEAAVGRAVRDSGVPREAIFVITKLYPSQYANASAQVILRWNLQKGVVVIPGSSDPDHIRENLDLFDFALTEAEMEQINALDRNEKHDWY